MAIPYNSWIDVAHANDLDHAQRELARAQECWQHRPELLTDDHLKWIELMIHKGKAQEARAARQRAIDQERERIEAPRRAAAERRRALYSDAVTAAVAAVEGALTHEHLQVLETFAALAEQHS